MASSQASEKLTSRMKITHKLSGDASTAKVLEWLDFRDFNRFLGSVCAAALTGLGVTAFSIVADAESDGSGGNETIKTHAVGSAPDAAGDYLFLECTAEEIAHVGEAASKNLRYVGIKIQTANAADNIVGTSIRSGGREYDALTADYVS